MNNSETRDVKQLKLCLQNSLMNIKESFFSMPLLSFKEGQELKKQFFSLFLKLSTFSDSNIKKMFFDDHNNK